MTELPDKFTSEDELEEFMTRPSVQLIEALKSVDGDIMVLGVAGKIGLTLARLAKRAAPEKRIIGVARFSDPQARSRLEAADVETVACDLLDRDQIAGLEPCRNILFLAGRKFGAASNQPLTWAMNGHVPALVAEQFPSSRIVAYSTACVYPMTDVASGGSVEGDPLTPIGEYANSCIARERIFEYFSALNQTPGKLYRLSYAIDMRYGVLHDIANAVFNGIPVSLAISHVNVIWQGDANSYALQLLAHVTTPTSPINISGPDMADVRQIAEAFGRHFDRQPEFVGDPQPESLLMNTQAQRRLFGPPTVPLDKLIEWTADWISSGRGSLGKPTHFEVRDGTY